MSIGNSKGMIFLTGPSGIGKSHIARLLSQTGQFGEVLSTMTRTPRAGEIDGVTGHFVTAQCYGQMDQAGELLTNKDILGEKYAFTRASLMKVLSQKRRPVVTVFASTVGEFLGVFPKAKTILLQPASEDILLTNMRRRGDDMDMIASRMQSARKELACMAKLRDKIRCSVFTITDDTDAAKIVQTLTQQ